MTSIVERLKGLLLGGEPENAYHHGAHSQAHERTHEDCLPQAHEPPEEPEARGDRPPR